MARKDKNHDDTDRASHPSIPLDHHDTRDESVRAATALFAEPPTERALAEPRRVVRVGEREQGTEGGMSIEASKRGRSARRKGGDGEREAAASLTEVLSRPFRRAVGQSRRGADAPDIEPDGWQVGGTESAAWVEVKRGSATITAAMQQAVKACGSRLPIVLTRQDRGEWLVTVRLADLTRLWAWLDAVLEPLPEDVE